MRKFCRKFYKMTTYFCYELHIEPNTYYDLQICWSLMWWYVLLTRQVHCVAATCLSRTSTILQIWRTLSQTLFTRTEIYYVCQISKLSEGFNLVKTKQLEMILSWKSNKSIFVNISWFSIKLIYLWMNLMSSSILQWYVSEHMGMSRASVWGDFSVPLFL